MECLSSAPGFSQVNLKSAMGMAAKELKEHRNPQTPAFFLHLDRQMKVRT